MNKIYTIVLFGRPPSVGEHADLNDTINKLTTVHNY